MATDVKRRRTGISDSECGAKGVWSNGRVFGEELWQPQDVTTNLAGILYVTDLESCSVIYFSAQGEYLGGWGGRGESKGMFERPIAVTVGIQNGHLSEIISEFQKVLALAAFPPGILPICAAYNGKECVYVLDARHRRVQMFECDGTFIRMWGTAGTKEGQFWSPNDCIAADNGFIYVSDSHTGLIQFFDEYGTRRGSFTSPNVGFECLCSPYGLHISPSNLLYVADENNKAAHVFQLDGTFLQTLLFPLDVMNLFTTDDRAFCVTSESRRELCVVRNGTIESIYGTDPNYNAEVICSGKMTQSPYGTFYITDRSRYRIAFRHAGSDTWQFITTPKRFYDYKN